MLYAHIWASLKWFLFSRYLITTRKTQKFIEFIIEQAMGKFIFRIFNLISIWCTWNIPQSVEIFSYDGRQIDFGWKTHSLSLFLLLHVSAVHESSTDLSGECDLDMCGAIWKCKVWSTFMQILWHASANVVVVFLSVAFDRFGCFVYLKYFVVSRQRFQSHFDKNEKK